MRACTERSDELRRHETADLRSEATMLHVQLLLCDSLRSSLVALRDIDVSFRGF